MNRFSVPWTNLRLLGVRSPKKFKKNHPIERPWNSKGNSSTSTANLFFFYKNTTSTAVQWRSSISNLLGTYATAKLNQKTVQDDVWHWPPTCCHAPRAGASLAPPQPACFLQAPSHVTCKCCVNGCMFCSVPSSMYLYSHRPPSRRKF